MGGALTETRGWNMMAGGDKAIAGLNIRRDGFIYPLASLFG